MFVPPETALVSVRVGGVALPRPRRDPDGRVWLRARSEGDAAESRLDLAVSRLVRAEDARGATRTGWRDLLRMFRTAPAAAS